MSIKKQAYENSDLQEINFYGGEPLLEFEKIKKIVNLVKTINPAISFSMTTSGSLLNEKTCDFLISNNFKLAVSLDLNKKNT